ncbi:hypothetical protein COPCOM_01452 [Coprococcus comes ATCC 27758]|uniref:Uncharacterized protein n=1 Tax=Coprococcus comes ATCC 27758 TaxID=470146 RepID=C0B8H8_9FIRM|nr:hypothetical protein COPCOM_01452 [Coprococcus comes ATCC 27758]
MERRSFPVFFDNSLKKSSISACRIKLFCFFHLLTKSETHLFYNKACLSTKSI